jgi:glycosyltransferase involved in cell wall biosynthesis
MLITVAVPTHNRPWLLREALASIVAQTHPQWEVVVVDDGSAPPVLESTLRELLGERFILVRHDQAQGIAAAKNAGVAAAHGEVVVHLDDDDLLAPTALAQIAAVYARHPGLECLFVNVEPFGTYAPGTAANQSHAVSGLLERAQRPTDHGSRITDHGSRITDHSVAFFDRRLFAALLKSVPMAMQRPAARKTLWDRVGPLRRDSYLPEPEWAMKSALLCEPALLLHCAYLARMDGQNNVTVPEQKLKHMHAAVDIRKTLLAWIARNPTLAGHAGEVRHSLAGVYFNQAYHHQRNGHCRAAWRPLFASFATHPQWYSLRFALRLLASCTQRREAD